MPSAVESGPEPRPAESARMFPLTGNSPLGTSPWRGPPFLKEDGDRETPCPTPGSLVLRLECLSESLGRLVKTPISGPNLRISGSGIGLKNVHF